jgi:hypothetical protein
MWWVIGERPVDAEMAAHHARLGPSNVVSVRLADNQQHTEAGIPLF